MRKDPLINELTDWIEELDEVPLHTIGLNPAKASDLQHLLLRCRKEIINAPVDNQDQTEKEKQNEITRQVKAEIAKQMAKRGIKA